MRLGALTESNCEVVRRWRVDLMAEVRTPYMLTREMQENFYRSVICDRNSPNRFYAILDKGDFVGMGGWTNIQWENSIAEISVVIDPKKRREGLGWGAVKVLLDEAFLHLNLKTCIAECYECGNLGFWEKVAKYYHAYTTRLPARKFWDGKYWGSLYLSIDRDRYVSNFLK